MADNNTTNTGALVAAGLANIGESSIATTAHVIVDVNGNVIPDGGLPAATALTWAATTVIAVPLTGLSCVSVTLAGATLLSFTGLTAGLLARGRIYAKQDATGSRVLTGQHSGAVTATLCAPSGAGSNVIPTSTTAAAVDVIDWQFDGTNMHTLTAKAEA